MKKLLTVCLLAISSCTNDVAEEDHPETQADTSVVPTTVVPLPDSEPKAKTTTPNEGRRLRHLFFANGGLLGFFSDGTVAGCPRCDLAASNIETLRDTKPHTTYKTEGINLVLENNEVMTPENKGGQTPEWALIDYKWVIQVED